MPSSPTVWIVLIVTAAVVVGLMVWRGIGGTFVKGNWKFSLHDAPKPAPIVKVAESLHMEGGKAGNITGVKSAAGADVPVASEVDVANNASLSHAEVGDITGVDISGGSRREREK